VSFYVASITSPVVSEKLLDMTFQRQLNSSTALEWDSFFGFILSIGVVGHAATELDDMRIHHKGLNVAELEPVERLLKPRVEGEGPDELGDSYGPQIAKRFRLANVSLVMSLGNEKRFNLMILLVCLLFSKATPCHLQSYIILAVTVFGATTGTFS
jgi:hypothetical protein